MMSPRQWDRWVVAYDGAGKKHIKTRDSEALIHVHCHGRVGTLLKSLVEMGVDSTDPVEPPPQGDIEFEDARKIVGDKMVLFGNIEFLDMETKTPDQIEQIVRSAIEQAGKKRLVLYPSATPHERHTPKLLANARRYIEAGLKYGAM
jgi:uroporphyrinogen decarboxylase